jgi:glutamate-1-semialdehyde 2,1-aminomutase
MPTRCWDVGVLLRGRAGHGLPQREARGYRADTARFAKFFHFCLEAGVYLPPSQFESCFVSLAHDDGIIQRTVRAFEDAFAAVP